jgi:CheY-like chemotaxis protein
MIEILNENMTGFRVLVVEDQMLIAMEIEDALRDLGCMVVGPVGSVVPAVQLVQTQALGAAVLDVNLGGEQVFPVAEELQARNIPFIFTTGYGEMSLPEKWRDRPHLSKPFTRRQIERFIRDSCGDRARVPSL